MSTFDEDSSPPPAAGRTRTLSDASAMLHFTLRSFLSRLQDLKAELVAVAQLISEFEQCVTAASSDSALPSSSAAAATAHSRLTLVEQGLQTVQSAAASCDPASTLVSGRQLGLEAQLEVLAQCGQLAQQAHQLRLALTQLLAGQPAWPHAEQRQLGRDDHDTVGSHEQSKGSTEPLPSWEVSLASEVASTQPLTSAEANFSALPAISARPAASEAFRPPPTSIDPAISTVVARVLTGRFAAVASDAIASSVGQDAHALIKQLELLPLSSLVSLLASQGYHTLQDLAKLTPTQARGLLSGMTLEGETRDVASSAAILSPRAMRAPAQAAAAPVTQAAAAPVTSAATLVMKSPGDAAPTLPSFPQPWSSGSTHLLSAPLVSPIDRGIIVPDVASVLGRGKFGDVYRCFVGRRVCALKMVKVGATADAFQATMRVVEEAKHLMTLRHENILEYRDVFGHHASAQNFVCIVMELCDGGSLSDVVFDQGLTLSGLADLCRQLASALAYAHGHGVVHCDVKLENVLIRRMRGPRDLVKLGDWGLARREASSLSLPPATQDVARGSVTTGTLPSFATPAVAAAVAAAAAAARGSTSGVHSAAHLAASPHLPRSSTELLWDADEEQDAQRLNSSIHSVGHWDTQTPLSRSNSWLLDAATAEDDADPLLLQPGAASTLALGATSTTYAREMMTQAGVNPYQNLDQPELTLLEVAQRAAARKGLASSAVRGTLCYLPPEALEEGRHLRLPGSRWAADIWALGCLLWEAATGECLPMGTNDAILGRLALQSAESWLHKQEELMRTFVAALEAAKQRGQSLDTSSSVPKAKRGEVEEVKQALCALLLATWSLTPLSRPAAADVAAYPLWRPDLHRLKLPPAVSAASRRRSSQTVTEIQGSVESHSKKDRVSAELDEMQAGQVVTNVNQRAGALICEEGQEVARAGAVRVSATAEEYEDFAMQGNTVIEIEE